MFKRNKSEDPQRLVVLQTFQVAVDAEMTASILRSAGIECQVLDENVSMVMPYLKYSTPNLSSSFFTIFLLLFVKSIFISSLFVKRLPKNFYYNTQLIYHTILRSLFFGPNKTIECHGFCITNSQF